jgi:hypothetical protein
MDVFYPASTNAIAATAVSSARMLPTLVAGEHMDSVVFYNDGPGVVFVTMGGDVSGVSNAVATLPVLTGATGAQGNATPIPVGSVINLRRGSTETSWAAICLAAGSANVYATPGEGL